MEAKAIKPNTVTLGALGQKTQGHSFKGKGAEFMQPVVVEEGQEQSFGSVDMKQFTVNPHMSQSKSQKMIQPKKRTIIRDDISRSSGVQSSQGDQDRSMSF